MTNKSDSRCANVLFCCHSYDYRPNWTPFNPITINNNNNNNNNNSNNNNNNNNNNKGNRKEKQVQRPRTRNTENVAYENNSDPCSCWCAWNSKEGG